MMSKWSYRHNQSLLLAITTLVLGTAYYLQYHTGLEPCPLCIMQRFCAFLLGMFCLMGISTSSLKRARIISLLQIVFSLMGIYFAGRQLWLQSGFGEHAGACMPEIDILIQYFPWKDIVHAFLLGSGDCAEKQWHFLGLTMPAWSLFYFLIIFLINAILIWRVNIAMKQIKS